MSSSVNLKRKIARWLPPALIFLLTFLAFLPALPNGFVNWDDGYNFVDNPNYRGLGWAQLRWMFTTFHMGHYIPFTWVTLGIDYLIWGMNPFGYHLTSLLLHAAAAVLFYFVALRLLTSPGPAAHESLDAGTRFAAALASLLFAIHPLRVESVAWATERRDVLSGVFYLLTILSYLRAGEIHRDPNARRLWLAASVLGFTAALLSKEIVVTLPLVLILLDVYPLRRLKPGESRVWKEKLPFFLLAAGCSAVALFARGPEYPLTPLEEHGVPERLAQAAFGLVFYLGKTVWPADLAPFYPLPVPFNPLEARFLLSGALVLGITAILFYLRHRLPALLCAWAYFAIVLAPALGFFQQGEQIAADRYTYLAGFGWATLAGGGVLRLLPGRQTGLPRGPFLVWTVSSTVTVVAILGTLTWRQAGVWHDSITLWTRVLAVTPDSYFAHYNLANALRRLAKNTEAMRHYRRSLELDPEQPLAHNHLGALSDARGDAVGAIEHYRRSLEIDPSQAQVHAALGNVLARVRRYDEALRHLRRSLQMRPNHAPTYNNLGVALAEQGRSAEAVAAYRQAIRFEPSLMNAYNNLGNALADQGNFSGALEAYQEALRLEPNYAHAHFNLGRLYLKLKDRESTVTQQKILEGIHPEMARRLADLIKAGRGPGMPSRQ